jgi:hypothetical protein
MLIQQMTRFALQLQDGDEGIAASLQESEKIFNQNLSALRNGGHGAYLTNSIVDLPDTCGGHLLAALDEEIPSGIDTVLHLIR